MLFFVCHASTIVLLILNKSVAFKDDFLSNLSVLINSDKKRDYIILL